MIFNEKFQKAVCVVIQNEGGYVNNAEDPGGETKYGISKRMYPSIDIKTLTIKQAEEIYYKDYWLPYKYDNINDINIVSKIFDIAVNIGNASAHILLNRALRAMEYKTVESKALDDATFAIVNSCDIKCLLASFRSEAAGYYRILASQNPRFVRFLKGWLCRAYS
jgi:lysozyme family protein